MLYQAGDADIVVVFVGSTHRPVDAGDGKLDASRFLALVKVDVFKHQWEDEFAVAIGRVELLDAVGGREVLVSDDWQDGNAVVQTSTYSIMPVTT